LGSGRLDEARRCYAEAVAADAADALAHVNLAYVLLEQQQPAAAADLLQRAATLGSPDDSHLPDTWYLLGRARQQMEDAAAAIAAYADAVRARPGFEEPRHALVPLLLGAGRHAEALRCAQELMHLRPSTEARVLLAQAHYALADDAAVLAVLEPVLRDDPRHPDALAGRGHALLRQGEFEEAAQSFREALQAHGASADRLVDLASACHRLGANDEVTALVAAALEREPAHAAALNLRVVGLTEALRLPEAEAAARQALAVHPADADLHWSLAIALLLQGKLQEGWAEHRWRWRTAAMAASRPAARPEPAWRGEPLAGRSILLVAEQGFGDTLQFARFVPLVAQRAGRVLLQARAPLRRLLAQLPANCELVDPGDSVQADVQCALMDLADVFGVGLPDLAAGVPYLHADAAQVQRWKARVRDDSTRLCVGLAWSGNPAHTNDRRRSIPLQAFAPLLRSDCRFVALQPELRAADEALAGTLPIMMEPARELGDFADTAALLESLDLVITVDTSVAHLAGALGCRVWILLPHVPDWRWMTGRNDSPWYPTARLFRQRTPGDWAGVLREVEEELRRCAGPLPCRSDC
jgi:Flp pilus assembly protein TadD